jgi:hypothetical protein
MTKMQTATYLNWCSDVVSILRGSDLYTAAVESQSQNSGSAAPGDEAKFLDWMRGDEPHDVFESGNTASQYAEFLLDEWALFGPAGE